MIGRSYLRPFFTIFSVMSPTSLPLFRFELEEALTTGLAGLFSSSNSGTPWIDFKVFSKDRASSEPSLSREPAALMPLLRYLSGWFKSPPAAAIIFAHSARACFNAGSEARTNALQARRSGSPKLYALLNVDFGRAASILTTATFPAAELPHIACAQ